MTTDSRTRPQDHGFTLVELLTVIAVLGILAGVVIFAVGSAREDSVAASCEADVKTVTVAAEAWKAKNNSYPASMAAMVGDGLKALPGADGYTIDYDADSGAVTGTLMDGGDCND